MPNQHKWSFKARFRSRAFGWKGSNLACQRLKEAVAEIKKVAKADPVTAGEGVVSLMERIWPALEQVDSSSGSLGSAVYWTQQELLPIAIAAPADRKTRDGWLDRLWKAIEEDGVDYLSGVGDRWGELCASSEIASNWADRFISEIRAAWSGPDYRGYVCGTTLCLSSLLAAGRHQELHEFLALEKHRFWHYRKFGVQSLLSRGCTEEALSYADSCRGLNQPDSAIDATCEEILLDLGRAAEAYEKFAYSANQQSTGLATFRTIRKKYPHHAAEKILSDLARWSGDRGLWFAAAKDAGALDLALQFARSGRTDPRTLSRAARDLLKKDAKFSLEIGLLAIQRIVDGYGYDITGLDLKDAFNHSMAAAAQLEMEAQAREELLSIAAEKPGTFSASLVRLCSNSFEHL